MLVDAIILTGGRSSRLDSVPKAEFVVDGITLLDHTLDAARGARRTVVVGLEPAAPLPPGILLVREEPPFSGPVAGLAAGVSALGAVARDAQLAASDAFLVLACDMPRIGLAVPGLLAALQNSPAADGVIAIDTEGRRQPLAALYRAKALVSALEAAPAAGLPMFRLLDRLTLIDVQVPANATRDVDTWDDARKLGASPPSTSASPTAAATLNHHATSPKTEGNHHG